MQTYLFAICQRAHTIPAFAVLQSTYSFSCNEAHFDRVLPSVSPPVVTPRSVITKTEYTFLKMGYGITETEEERIGVVEEGVRLRTTMFREG